MADSLCEIPAFNLNLDLSAILAAILALLGTLPPIPPFPTLPSITWPPLCPLD